MFYDITDDVITRHPIMVKDRFANFSSLNEFNSALCAYKKGYL